MYGKPKKVEGKCCAELSLGDDYGDNSCTIMCQLVPGHPLPHEEQFMRQDKPVVITWFVDETEEELSEDK